MLRGFIRNKQSQDSESRLLMDRVENALSFSKVESSNLYVLCFSEQQDDLSQWRAYSGGEGGYAIRFFSVKLPSKGRLIRVEYDAAAQREFVRDVVDRSETLFLEGEGRKGGASLEEWAQEFAQLFLSELVPFMLCLKHDAFKSEKEWRLIYLCGADGFMRLQFRQRRSMMSRHLPIQFSEPLPGGLPISGITVGPCRYPELSKIAVSQLLDRHGFSYPVFRVELSKVPYREV